jgi:hypothetical protein
VSGYGWRVCYPEDMGLDPCPHCAAGSPVVCGECGFVVPAGMIVPERQLHPQAPGHPFRPVHRTPDGDVGCTA